MLLCEKICLPPEYLNRARVDLLLKARLYAHHFSNIDSPECRCGHPETLMHLFLQCRAISNVDRLEFFESVRNIYPDFTLIQRNAQKVNFLLYGVETMDIRDQSKLFELVTDYIHNFRS